MVKVNCCGNREERMFHIMNSRQERQRYVSCSRVKVVYTINLSIERTKFVTKEERKVQIISRLKTLQSRRVASRNVTWWKRFLAT
jgi:hypothetical protein